MATIQQQPELCPGLTNVHWQNASSLQSSNYLNRGKVFLTSCLTAYFEHPWREVSAVQNVAAAALFVYSSSLL